MTQDTKVYDTLDEVINNARYLYTKDDYDTYYNFQSVGDRFGISMTAFYQLMNKGKMPSLKKVPAVILAEVTMACMKHSFDKNSPEIVEIMTDEQKRAILNTKRINRIIGYDKPSTFSYRSTWIGHRLVQHVPVDMIDDDNIRYFKERALQSLGARQAAYAHISIKGIPEILMDDEIYTAACLAKGENLNYVPEEFKTQELCQETVEKHGAAIAYVPEEFKQELYILAIKSGEGLSAIPQEDRTEKICAIAVETNPEQFKAVPEELKSYTLCLKALDANAELMKQVPEDKIDEEMAVRFLASVFMNRFEHYFVINSDWKETGEDTMLRKVLAKVGADTLEKKRALAFKALDHTEGDCFQGILKLSRDGSGWSDFQGLVHGELALHAVKLDIENYRIVPDDVAKKFWKDNLK